MCRFRFPLSQHKVEAKTGFSAGIQDAAVLYVYVLLCLSGYSFACRVKDGASECEQAHHDISWISKNKLV